MSRDAVKFGRMSKKQREKVEDEVRYHRERQLVTGNGRSNGGSGLAIGLGPGSLPVISSSTGHVHGDHHLGVSDPSPDSSVYDPSQSQQQQQPSSSQQSLVSSGGVYGNSGVVNGNSTSGGSNGPFGPSHYSLSGHSDGGKWSDVGGAGGGNGPSNGYSPYPPSVMTPYDVVRSGSDFVDSTTFDGTTSTSINTSSMGGHHPGGHHHHPGHHHGHPSVHLAPIHVGPMQPLDASPEGGHHALDQDYDVQMDLVNMIRVAHVSTCQPLNEIAETIRRQKMEEIELDLDNFKNMVSLHFIY